MKTNVNKPIKTEVKTNISLEVRNWPSSIDLSIFRWVGSSVFSWEACSSAFIYTLLNAIHYQLSLY